MDVYQHCKYCLKQFRGRYYVCNSPGCKEKAKKEANAFYEASKKKKQDDIIKKLGRL